MLALDTDVLVHWANADGEHHASVVSTIADELSQPTGKLALTPQCCWEFIHVVTDGRRFDRPLEMKDALHRVRRWWDAPEVKRVPQDPSVVHHALELMEVHRLGRRRILDTVLATTLGAAGIRRLATLNGRDFAPFDFIEVVDPRVLAHP